MDLTLPGYNYLGPGNSLENGEPTNPSDAAAYLHDVEYQKYIDAGLNPYVAYNRADEEAILNFGSDWGGIIGKTVFATKRTLARLGIIDHISLPMADRRTDIEELAPASKRVKMENTEPITIVTVPRGAVNRPIIGRGAIVNRKSTRSGKRFTGSRYRRYGRFRRSYKRRYAYRRRY